MHGRPQGARGTGGHAPAFVANVCIPITELYYILLYFIKVYGIENELVARNAFQNSIREKMEPAELFIHKS